MAERNDGTAATASSWWTVDRSHVPVLTKGATPLVERCIRTYGWTEAFTLRVLQGYKQLLMWKHAFDDWDATKLSPSLPVDQMWHMHILDIKNYADDCDLLFGRVVYYHAPDRGFDADKRSERINNTKSAIRMRFGEDYDREVWDFGFGDNDEEEDDGERSNKRVRREEQAPEGLCPDRARSTEVSRAAVSPTNNDNDDDDDEEEPDAGSRHFVIETKTRVREFCVSPQEVLGRVAFPTLETLIIDFGGHWTNESLNPRAIFLAKGLSAATSLQVFHLHGVYLDYHRCGSMLMSAVTQAVKRNTLRDLRLGFIHLAKAFFEETPVHMSALGEAIISTLDTLHNLDLALPTDIFGFMNAAAHSIPRGRLSSKLRKLKIRECGMECNNGDIYNQWQLLDVLTSTHLKEVDLFLRERVTNTSVEEATRFLQRCSNVTRFKVRFFYCGAFSYDVSAAFVAFAMREGQWRENKAFIISGLPLSNDAVDCLRAFLSEQGMPHRCEETSWKMRNVRLWDVVFPITEG